MGCGYEAPAYRQAGISVTGCGYRKGFTVTMLVSKQESRNLKLEYPASIYEPPCLPAGRDTSFPACQGIFTAGRDNDKRHFEFYDTPACR
ncbi:MAG: hypothetical protein FJ106_06480 [Deltaproteobacteria bacterium]|nr:hypothetical protein [Deltaproteobacteria bacterium]